MNITVKAFSEYKELSLSYIGTTITTGLLDVDERRTLANTFIKAAEELLYGDMSLHEFIGDGL